MMRRRRIYDVVETIWQSTVWEGGTAQNSSQKFLSRGVESTVQSHTMQFLTLLNAGGGRNPPPLSNVCGSPKNAQRKSCQFFVTFPKYVNGVLETTFCSQTTFGQAGRGQKWSKLA